MIAAPGLALTIYTAEPGSPSEEGLRLLSSWGATQETRLALGPRDDALYLLGHCWGSSP